MKQKSRRSSEFFNCPHCGAPVPCGALACRACGSDAQTGWKENADVWEADIPTGYATDDEFDYDDYIRREFSSQGERSPRKELKNWPVLIAVALICLAMIVLMILRW